MQIADVNVETIETFLTLETISCASNRIYSLNDSSLLELFKLLTNQFDKMTINCIINFSEITTKAEAKLTC